MSTTSTPQPARWQAYADSNGAPPAVQQGQPAVSWLAASREWAALCQCGWASFAASHRAASGELASHACLRLPA